MVILDSKSHPHLPACLSLSISIAHRNGILTVFYGRSTTNQVYIPRRLVSAVPLPLSSARWVLAAEPVPRHLARPKACHLIVVQNLIEPTNAGLVEDINGVLGVPDHLDPIRLFDSTFLRHRPTQTVYLDAPSVQGHSKLLRPSLTTSNPAVIKLIAIK